MSDKPADSLSGSRATFPPCLEALASDELATQQDSNSRQLAAGERFAIVSTPTGKRSWFFDAWCRAHAEVFGDGPFPFEAKGQP